MNLPSLNNPDEDGKSKFSLRVTVLLLYTAIIFATLPVFPTVWNFVSRLFPDLLKGFTYGFVPTVIVFFYIYFIFINKKRDLFFFVYSAVFLFSYGPLIYFYCEFSAERFHLAEYGLLAFIAYWCLKPRIKSMWIYVAVFFYSAIIGLTDEIIQGILPNRVYEFKDVTINWFSVLLATGLLTGVTWKDYIKRVVHGKFIKFGIVIIIMLISANALLIFHKYWRPPLNVILLTVDTFRPDHLGSYGYHRDTTPFLDSVARKGVIFKNVIGSAPWTTPGLISVFSGLYPTVHGVTARGRSLLPGTPTIFKVFKEHRFEVPNISYLTEIANFQNLGLGQKAPEAMKEALQPGQELFLWLNKHHRKRFILWYHYRFLHLPYNPAGEFNIFLTEDQKQHLKSENVQSIMKETVIPHKSRDFRPEEKDITVALYDGQLREFDKFVRKLFNRLTRWKLHRNTLLVITADHGEEFFEHGFVGHASTMIHATLYDEVIKIPLIIYAPSRIKKGEILTKPVRQVDIMPTILDMAGLPIPQDINGISLVPRMRGDSDEKQLTAFSESIAGGYQSTMEQEKMILRSIRTEDWKLICPEGYEETECELFDLKKDPLERKNLSRERSDILDSLKKRLDKHLTGMRLKRLAMLSGEAPEFSPGDIPEDARLERPVILTPEQNTSIHLKQTNGRMEIIWKGDKRLTYVIEYDVGKGWRNLKGSIPVKGTRKSFGPLPKEAWEPLPYWNPYRIRISPYGKEEYWSDWLEFNIEE